MSGFKIGLNAGGVNRPGTKPHPSVTKGKQVSESFYLKRSDNLTRMYKQVLRDFKHYNLSERPVIKQLDRADQTYMNSAAGPVIIDTLEQIAQNRANIAKLHSAYKS